jgi:ABC-type uncharacterized transport system fused permease/ATPase subunit
MGAKRLTFLAPVISSRPLVYCSAAFCRAPAKDLMQIRLAFGQADSMSWFIDSCASLANWRHHR